MTPPDSISNEELVASFNRWVERENAANADAIARGEKAPLEFSSVAFIEKASGIRSRHVLAKAPILDPAIMAPRWPERPNETLGVLAEMAVTAAKDALCRAGREAREIDAVICACSNLERAYPAVAIEVQDALGASGFAFDMNVACSSATFGLQTAADMVRAGHARTVLIVNPEVCSGHLNFRDRDSHFIFGDVATAILVEDADRAPPDHWDILGTRLLTRFSNTIRNNFGFLNRAAPEGVGAPDKLFVQEGRKVFKDVVPMVSDLILSHLLDLGIRPSSLRRLWLHQANANMNRMIAGRVLGHEASEDESPTVLDTYANTSSAGSVIAFHKHSGDLAPGDTGLLCSFGAGYSAGSVVLRKVAA
jgi:beta-ketodecanoyl-[acyl-carrier-protein] synthase